MVAFSTTQQYQRGNHVITINGTPLIRYARTLARIENCKPATGARRAMGDHTRIGIGEALQATMVPGRDYRPRELQVIVEQHMGRQLTPESIRKAVQYLKRRGVIQGKLIPIASVDGEGKGMTSLVRLVGGVA